MRIRVEELTEDRFQKFGHVLGEPITVSPSVANETSSSWLGVTDLMGIGSVPSRPVTFLKIHARPALYDRIEKHETSAEAFIPLEGRSILLVAPAEAVDEQGRPDMARARAFLMDGSQGILMRPATWHAVPYTLTDVATYLVLVDDTILAKQDLHITPIEPIEFDLSGVAL
jgi:ureidoglycolate hydrolase